MEDERVERDLEILGNDGGRLALDALIAEDPEHHLGGSSVAEFGPRLPFLLKVLAADSPLSLQVHPTLEQARAVDRTRADGAAPASLWKVAITSLNLARSGELEFSEAKSDCAALSSLQ